MTEQNAFKVVNRRSVLCEFGRNTFSGDVGFYEKSSCDAGARWSVVSFSKIKHELGFHTKVVSAVQHYRGKNPTRQRLLKISFFDGLSVFLTNSRFFRIEMNF